MTKQRIDKNENRIFYYHDDLLHREDGPAVEWIDGYQEWYHHGKLHRLDGPAIVHPYGLHKWFVNNKWIECKTQKEFVKLMKLRAFW